MPYRDEPRLTSPVLFSHSSDADGTVDFEFMISEDHYMRLVNSADKRWTTIELYKDGMADYQALANFVESPDKFRSCLITGSYDWMANIDGSGSFVFRGTLQICIPIRPIRA
jgi:hypothetical protein